jgi:hypothetical protein
MTKHCPHVIHDGQGRQEDLESTGGSGRDECQDAEREGDVGRHGNRPPTRLHRSTVCQEIDESRDEHPADRPGYRERRLARRCQLARKHLAFDFQPHKEEENRHEPIVDPLMHGERKPMTPTGNGDGRRQQGAVSFSPRRIGNDERGARAGDK